MSIRVENISKIYGTQKALNNMSFEVKTGEIVGLLGPNGAGKSTLMKILTGFLPPSSGQAFVNEINVMENSLEIRKIIGYLPEHNPLYLDMYVKEYLEFSGKIYKMRKSLKSKLADIIEITGLTPESKKKIGALSKGYRQRVGLAQALLHDPEVLILDEPTSGLDPNQIVEIRNLISQVGKLKTLMLSTHIMQEVEAICDRIIIIKKGELVANSEAATIIDKNNASTQTILIELDSKVDQKVLEAIPEIRKVAHIKENQWLLESNSSDDVRAKVFHFAVENKLTVLSMTQKEKSLEEVFQDLTR